MKRVKHLLVGLATLVLAFLTTLPTFAADNLLANPSVEAASGSNPANWRTDRWGDNETSLTYANDGHEGTKSLRIDMTRHADGDAKWMADAVNIESSKEYTYTSFYKANVATEIDLQYTHADGSVTYEYVQYVPESSDWQELTAHFKTPATAKKVVVLHVLSQTGWLQTDEFSLGEKIQGPPADDENLIANPSFETASGATPTAWNKNSWGATSAQFIHETTGRTDGRSATVKITQHTDGDAKWYANPVDVQAGKTYLYRDYFKADVATRVVVAFIDANDNYQYAELEGAKAATDWTQYQVKFVVPENAVKASVFHLIDRVGTLTIDDISLQVAVPGGGVTSLIANPSLEDQASATMPTDWLHNKWGNNNASFNYVDEGHSGNKSVKVTMNNHVDGDAKWYFNPISTLEAGKQYRFNAWYKTNTLPHAVVMYLKADGTESYLGMPSPIPSASSATQWQQYTDTFSVPADAVAVSAFLFIDQNGWLQTDDYSISEYHPNGFARPLLTLTFDDGHEDNITTALPLLNQYGFKTTQCYATSFIEGVAGAVNNVKAFQRSGHEICSHTVTHPFLTSLNASKLQYELQHSKQYLESITGEQINDFASPYGDYNPTVNEAIKQYYSSHRTVDEGFNSKDNFDRYRLRVQNMLDTTTADQVRQWVQQAQADNTWLILVYHRVADDPEAYDTYTDDFAEQLRAISNSGIVVKTYRDALAETTSQL